MRGGVGSVEVIDHECTEQIGVATATAVAEVSSPSSRIILAVGPLMVWLALIDDTATTEVRQPAIAARIADLLHHRHAAQAYEIIPEIPP